MFLMFVVLVVSSISLLSQSRKGRKGRNTQSKEEMMNKRDALINEISYNKELLERTQRDKNVSLKQVQLLQNQIAAQEGVIGTYQSEIYNLDNDIFLNARTVASLHSYVDNLKAEYAVILVNTYKNHTNYDRLMFLFSASNFNTAYKRFLYLRQYGQYRSRQAELILNTTASIEEKMGILKEQKTEKNELLSQQNEVAEALQEKKVDKDASVNQLKKKEVSIRNDIASKKKKASQLNASIESIIRKEIDSARKRAEEESRKEVEARRRSDKSGSASASSGDIKSFRSAVVPTMTPEASVLSNSFSANQGSLPWPVERGVITEYFGSHPHSVLDGVMINNNGIDITTDAGSSVRAIFEGTVSSVVSNPSFQNAIIIKHGEYFSVYSNVTNVQVRAGDKVSTKQRIATVHTSNDGQTEIHLEIWRGTSKMNPSSWVAR